MCITLSYSDKLCGTLVVCETDTKEEFNQPLCMYYEIAKLRQVHKKTTSMLNYTIHSAILCDLCV